MDFSTWFTFVVTYTVISIILGPSVFMVLGQSVFRGPSAARACIVGDVLGGIFVMSFSYLGVGAILAASSQLFFLVKWAGVAYMALAYLGFSMIREAQGLDSTAISNDVTTDIKGSLRAGFFTGLFNPKAIIFYMAFLAQFIDPHVDQMTQFMILMMTASFVVALVLGAYALLAVRASRVFKSVRARRRIGFASGSFFLGGSVMMASTR